MYIFVKGSRFINLHWQSDECNEGRRAFTINEDSRDSTANERTIGTIVAEVNNDIPTYELADGFPVGFSIEGDTSGNGLIKYSNGNNGLDYESATEYLFQVKANYLSSTIVCEITVTILNVNEKPFWITSTSLSVNIFELEPANTQVGEPIHANDVDAGTSLTYSIEPEHEWFTIGDCSGQLSLKKGGIPNTPNVYTINVYVEDDLGLIADTSVNVTINILNLNHPPVFSNTADTFVYYVSLSILKVLKVKKDIYPVNVIIIIIITFCNIF